MAAACDTPATSGDDGVAGGAGGPPVAGVSLALLQPNQGGATAASTGILALRGSCLVIEANGIRTNLAFATHRTEWDASTGALRVGDRTYRLGERIEVGGALFTGDPSILPWVRRPRTECLERLWIVSSIGPA